MELTQPLILLMLLVVDIFLIYKPKIGLLNIIIGLFTIVFVNASIETLTDFTPNFKNYFVVLFVFVGLITIVQGINVYMKKGKKDN